MRLSQRILDENKKNNDRKKRAQNYQRDPDDDVETLTYDEVPKWGYLNDSKGVFADGHGDGINNQPDIFERTAIFHTRKQTDET